jgi:para-aminobenzoate synthetase component I
MIFSRFKWHANSVMELHDPQEAYIYYRHHRVDLLTGFPESYPIEQLLKKLEQQSLQARVKSPQVFHFYYELGLILMGLGHSVGDYDPLAIEIHYRRQRLAKPKASRLSDLGLRHLERPGWTEYKQAFQKVQQHLLDGNCYQINLTYPYDFETQDALDPRDIVDFFFSRQQLGAYAHATYLGEELILSNSPECLFHAQHGRIKTMPIKGTMPVQANWRSSWQEMLQDRKQQGELLMITDLLKNDLNRLDRPEARVLKLRAPLLVPGLLHQYSLLQLQLHSPISLAHTLRCLFPGGSITGAPKKRVMQLLQELERYQRGHYCGSTLLCMDEKKVASINIRTATIQPGERLWRYGAGGGITLLSKAHQEFQEMESKVASFLTMLGAAGY